MTDMIPELRRTFERLAAEPRGEARTVALEALLDAVDAAGDQPLLNEVLVAIVGAYRWSEDSMRQLTAFGRLLRNFETAPEWFDAATLTELYWWMHNMAARMIERPDVPLASIEEFLDRMRRCYAEAGRSPYPAHQAEYLLAAHLGDEARTARALAALHATEPDYIDDCEPCVRFVVGAAHADAGEHERALELWKPMLEDGMGCPVQPHENLAASLAPLVELGRLDQARANHLRGWQLIRGKDEMVLPFVDHVRFCALTGNEARAVELLTARADLFTLGIDPMFRLRLLEAAQLACRALAAAGHGAVELPGPDGRGAPADVLHDRLDAERREIAGRFDRRNGNGTQSRRSGERVAFTGARPHVPLGLKAAAAPPRPRPEPASSTAADLERLLAEARAGSDDFADDRLERWERVGDAAERLGVALEPADEAHVLIVRLNETDDRDRERALAERAAALLRTAGLEGRALSLEASVLRTRMKDEPDGLRAEALRLLEAAARLADDDPVHSLRARVAVHAALAESDQSRGAEPDPLLREAIAELDAELAARPGERGVSEVHARLRLIAARLAETSEAGHAVLRTAYEIASAAGHTQETAVSALWYTAVLRREGRHDEALEVAETGVAAVRPKTTDGLAAAIHAAAAETAADLGHWARAELYAVRAAHHYDRGGAGGPASAARHLAGLAMARQGRHEAAVLVLEATLDEFAEAPEGERWRSADVRAVLADSHDELGDPQEGARHALEALRLMDGGIAHPNASQYARTAHQAGRLLEEAGDAESAVLAFGRAEQAWRELGVITAAAMSGRAAVWARANADAEYEVSEADEEAASEAFASLAAELRAQWRDEELHPSYRDSCRGELAETLLQHGAYLRQGAEAIRLLRESLEAFGEGGRGLGDRELVAARNLMSLLAESGDAEDAAAVAEQTLGRLEPDEDPDFRERVEKAVAAHRAR